MLRWDGGTRQEQLPSTSAKLASLLSGELLFYLVLLQFMSSRWGNAAGFPRLLGLAGLCLFATSRLVVRDLHWRSLLAAGDELTAVLVSIGESAILPFELAFAACTALALRGLPRAGLVVSILCCAAAASTALVIRTSWGDILPGWQIGPAYLLVLVAASGILLAIATRLWTPRKLFPLAQLS